MIQKLAESAERMRLVSIRMEKTIDRLIRYEMKRRQERMIIAEDGIRFHVVEYPNGMKAISKI